MNIFATSSYPTDCSQMLDDLRLNKMVVETAQMISTVASAGNKRAAELMRTTSPILYASTHAKHPCTLWAADNFDWMLFLLQEMLLEYKYRHGKHHGSNIILDTFSLPFFYSEPKTFCNCSLYKDVKDVHRAYRMTMEYKWQNDIREPKWTNRRAPDWAEFHWQPRVT